MADPKMELGADLDERAAAWLEQATKKLAANPKKELPVLFPQLGRRVGKDFVGGEMMVADGHAVNLGVWRYCDVAAFMLIGQAQPDDAQLLDLFWHGDMEERTMVLRCMASLPITGATIKLLEEAQRTNTVTHFEAAICDSNLLVRTLAAGREDFDQADFNRMVLKLAFLDLPLGRAFDVPERANAELSRMLQDLATEREAAGRKVWTDTNRLIARAPADGTIARIAGGLEHGDDDTRLASAEALAFLNDDRLRAFARERVEREPVERIREALEASIA